MLCQERNQGLCFLFLLYLFLSFCYFLSFSGSSICILKCIYILVTVMQSRICALLGKATQSTHKIKIAACIHSLMVGALSALAVEWPCWYFCRNLSQTLQGMFICCIDWSGTLCGLQLFHLLFPWWEWVKEMTPGYPLFWYLNCPCPHGGGGNKVDFKADLWYLGRDLEQFRS